LYTYNKRL